MGGSGHFSEIFTWRLSNPVQMGNVGTHFRAILTAALLHSRGLPEPGRLLDDGDVILCFLPAELTPNGSAF